MNRYAVLLALTTLISPAVGAAEMRGEELLWECSGETLSEQEAAIRGIHCIGYLKGMNDAHQIISGLNPSARMYCRRPPNFE
ncbi:MAG: hypothetical protein KatS3mg109_2055 [Pirellulaceae bacterium]|nr:MAG: hypothetical protein KatS3mg109_2055 [Pirellulaceae bacterium]